MTTYPVMSTMGVGRGIVTPNDSVWRLQPPSTNEMIELWNGNSGSTTPPAIMRTGVYGMGVDGTVWEYTPTAPGGMTELLAKLTPTSFNPADKSNIALSNNNLTALGSATFGGSRALAGKRTGKFYWEFTITTWASSYNDIGIFTSNIALDPSQIGTQGAGSFYVTTSGGILLNGGNITGTPNIGTPAAGNIIGCAIDLTDNLGWFRLGSAGNWNGSGTANPASGSGGINIAAANVSALFPGTLTGIAGDGGTANFGASAFGGTVPTGFTAGWG